MTDETIVEFIDRDQLLTSFGGTDTWTFDYITEKHLMIDQVSSCCYDYHHCHHRASV